VLEVTEAQSSRRAAGPAAKAGGDLEDEFAARAANCSGWIAKFEEPIHAERNQRKLGRPDRARARQPVHARSRGAGLGAMGRQGGGCALGDHLSWRLFGPDRLRRAYNSVMARATS